MDNISDNEDSTLRVQSTPVDMSAYRKNMFFDKYDDDNASSSGPYCLVGEDVPTPKSNSKKSIKQRRTTKRNSNLQNIQDEAGGTYCEIDDIPSAQDNRRDESYTDMASKESIYQVPPSDKQIPSESIYQVPPSEDLYQVPPSSKRFSGSGFPNTSSHNQNVDTIEEDYYGVPSSYPKHPDSNSKAINVPQKPKRTNHPMSAKSNSMDIYDNVNLQTQGSTECYDNVQLRNSPVAGENYDNVNIRNKESPSNESYYQQPPQSLKSSGSSEGIFYQGSPSDSYYQRPPSSSVSSNPGDDQYYQSPPTTFRAKPEGGIKQNSDQPQQYTFVKTKSMKQKRTATIVKKEIDISDSPPPPSSIPDEVTQKSIINENRQIDTSSEQEKKDKKIQEAKEILLAQAEVQPGSPKPIPKPRMKQSRTSERRVETGYRMSQIAAKQPLDEPYEWSKVFCFLVSRLWFKICPVYFFDNEPCLQLFNLFLCF